MTNEKGFTFIEALITLFLSMSAIITLAIIPQRILNSYGNYVDEAKYNLAYQTISLSISEDLGSANEIVATDSHFNIGDSEYHVNDEGVLRISNGKEVLLSTIPFEYTWTASHIHLINRSSDERSNESKTNIAIDIPLDADYVSKGGGTN